MKYDRKKERESRIGIRKKQKYQINVECFKINEPKEKDRDLE